MKLVTKELENKENPQLITNQENCQENAEPTKKKQMNKKVLVILVPGFSFSN